MEEDEQEEQTVVAVQISPARRRKAVCEKKQLAAARNEFWMALPQIVSGLAASAKEGNAAAAKMLLELHGIVAGTLAVTKKRRGSTLETRLLKEWAAHDAARQAAEGEAAGN